MTPPTHNIKSISFLVSSSANTELGGGSRRRITLPGQQPLLTDPARVLVQFFLEVFGDPLFDDDVVAVTLIPCPG